MQRRSQRSVKNQRVQRWWSKRTVRLIFSNKDTNSTHRTCKRPIHMCFNTDMIICNVSYYFVHCFIELTHSLINLVRITSSQLMKYFAKLVQDRNSDNSMCASSKYVINSKSFVKLVTFLILSSFTNTSVLIGLPNTLIL